MCLLIMHLALQSASTGHLFLHQSVGGPCCDSELSVSGDSLDSFTKELPIKTVVKIIW